MNITTIIESATERLRRTAVVAGLATPTYDDIAREAGHVLRARAVGDKAREQAARDRHARMLERATTAKT